MHRLERERVHTWTGSACSTYFHFPAAEFSQVLGSCDSAPFHVTQPALQRTNGVDVTTPPRALYWSTVKSDRTYHRTYLESLTVDFLHRRNQR